MKAIEEDNEREKLNHDQKFNIPGRTKQTIDNYVLKGYRPSGFVTALLANDLKTACGAADDINKRYIWEICSYIYNQTPYQSQGSYQAVENWLAMHRDQKND